MSRTNDSKNIIPKTVGETEACLKALLAGVKKHMSASSRWKVGKVPFDRPELEKKVAGLLALFVEPRETLAKFHSQTAERDEHLEEVSEFLKDMLTTLEYQLGRESTDLEDFGLRSRKKPAERTVEEKAAQVARALATKEKNGTIKPRGQEKPAA